MSISKNVTLIMLLTCLLSRATAQEKTDEWLLQLLRTQGSPLLQHVLNHPDSFQYQIIYTEINRDKNNKPSFKNHYVRVDRNRYYNPASTVKLPTALIALEKLNALRKHGLDIFSGMLTDSSFSAQTAVRKDTSAADGLPSIANYIKKIFLVSDNYAYNRLYEFNGQDELNGRLHQKGYKDVRIVRRFVTMTEEENRHTNAISFLNKSDTVLRLPPHYSRMDFDYSKRVLVGKAHYNRYDSLINAPFDFTRHNNLPLEDLRLMLQSVLFPASVASDQRFTIGKEDRDFLLQYMSEYPSESEHPKYDTSEFFDSYCKFFLYKSNRQKPPANIRIFNKPGWSYGYLTDAAYIVDFATRTELMLSAVIYTNRDGVLNDDKYEYKEIGYPFFKEIGEILLNYDRNRARKTKPNLDEFRFVYR
ncbi:MAG: serine hydrolase [Chitinophagaceae bacterium]|nr:serine hydrolase [Chitinophagaceae bacterium]